MAVKFDGSTHKIVRDGVLIGVENSAKFTLSFWVMSDGVASLDTIFSGGPSASSNIIATMTTAGEIRLVLRNAAGTIIYNAITDGAALEDSVWHHVVISGDMSVPSVEWRIDREEPTLTETTNDAGTVGFAAATKWTLGINYGLDTFADIALYDLLFKAGQSVDITDEDVLKLFVSSDGRSASGDKFWQNSGPNAGVKPVGYGVDAAIFNGEKPDVFFSGTFQSNKGTGGEFVASGLPFDEAASEPNVYRSAAHYDNKERWFESELSGFSYTRSRTFIEMREGHPKRGLRMGIDERDEDFRHSDPGTTYQQLLFNDREDDTEEWDR